MTDPALNFYLKMLESKLDKLTAAVVRLADAVERLQPAEIAHLPSEDTAHG